MVKPLKLNHIDLQLTFLCNETEKLLFACWLIIQNLQGTVSTTITLYVGNNCEIALQSSIDNSMYYIMVETESVILTNCIVLICLYGPPL